MDQLRAMRTFLEVARRGGFAAAARALETAPSVVTRQVAELEVQLGVRLLNRTTRRVALTSIGQRYLQRAEGILRELDDTAAWVSQGQRELRGRVRLLVPPLLAVRELVPRLHRLQALHPGIDVDLDAEGSDDLAGGPHDLAVVVRDSRLDGDFVAHALARSRVLLCAAPAYLRQHGRPDHPRDLARHALLAATMPGLPRCLRLVHASGDTAEVAPAGARLSSANAALCHAGALAGMGIAALPSFAVHGELALGELEPVLDDWRSFDLDVFVCLPSRRQVPAVVRTVLDFLRRDFPGHGIDPWFQGRDLRASMRLAA